MLFWALNLIVILWSPFHVKSDPIIQVNNKGISLDDAQTTMDPMNDDPEIIEESNSKRVIHEGDIMMQNDRNAVLNLWVTTRIPYVIDDELSSRKPDILKAIKMISDTTCLTFHQHRTEGDFLRFKKGRGCASYVGSIGGKQPIIIGPRCGVGNIAHEIMHALGFHHEHTRLDRDNYITVFIQNVREGAQKNFEKKSGDTMDFTYDVESIMHYGRKVFSANGRNTIISLDSTKNMGQRERLTNLDIQKIRHLYSCDPEGYGTKVEDPSGTKTLDDPQPKFKGAYITVPAIFFMKFARNERL